MNLTVDQEWFWGLRAWRGERRWFNHTPQPLADGQRTFTATLKQWNGARWIPLRRESVVGETTGTQWYHSGERGGTSP